MRKLFTLGEKVRLKKPHACGGEWWEILKVGMEVKLLCLNCSRQVKLKRLEFERKVREVKTS